MVIDIAANPVLLSVWQSLLPRVERARTLPNLDRARWTGALFEHSKMFAALAARDGPLLRRLSSEHFLNGLPYPSQPPGHVGPKERRPKCPTCLRPERRAASRDNAGRRSCVIDRTSRVDFVRLAYKSAHQPREEDQMDSASASTGLDPYHIRKYFEPLRVVDVADAHRRHRLFQHRARQPAKSGPLWLGMKFWGPAVTQRCVPGQQADVEARDHRGHRQSARHLVREVWPQGPRPQRSRQARQRRRHRCRQHRRGRLLRLGKRARPPGRRRGRHRHQRLLPRHRAR